MSYRSMLNKDRPQIQQPSNILLLTSDIKEFQKSIYPLTSARGQEKLTKSSTSGINKKSILYHLLPVD